MKYAVNLATVANQPDQASEWILKLLRDGNDVEIIRNGNRRWWHRGGQK